MRKLILTIVALGLATVGTARVIAQTPATTVVPAAKSPQASNAADLVRMLLGAAADRPPKVCVDRIGDAVNQRDEGQREKDFNELLSPANNPLCASYLIISSSQFQKVNTASGGALLKNLEKRFGLKALGTLKSVAQQEGSSTGTGGSTSLTAKGLSSKLLSVATEYGALTQSTSGATTTIQGTVAGPVVALMQNGALEECSVKVFAMAPCLHQGALAWMSRISYSVSYDTSPSSGTVTGTPTGTGSTTTAQQMSVVNNAHSVSAVTGKVVIIPGKLDTAAYGKADTEIALDPTAINKILESENKFSDMQFTDPATSPAYVSFALQEKKTLSAEATSSSKNEMVKKWRAEADGLTEALGVPPLRNSADAVKAAASPVLNEAVNLLFYYLEYLGDEEAAGFTAVMAAPPVLTAEYDWNRPSSAPSNSVFRAIYQKTYRPITVTINGAISIYDEPQPNVPGAGRLRDSQFATEVSHPFALTLPGSVTTTNFTVSGAFYDQYQSSPSILNVTPGTPVNGVTFTGLPSTATQVFGTTGNIAIGQLKLTAGGGSAVTVPLSITYSNRTELITSPTWKAQIGLSYDFDSLFSGK